MQQETNTLDGILDIALPVAPVDTGPGLFTVVAISILCSGIIIGIAYSWWKKPQQRCKRELGKLLHEHNKGHASPRETIFGLAAILCARVHCQQLSGKAEVPVHLQHYQSRWHNFVRELDAARYSGQDVSETMLNSLTHEARFWIGRW